MRSLLQARTATRSLAAVLAASWLFGLQVASGQDPPKGNAQQPALVPLRTELSLEARPELAYLDVEALFVFQAREAVTDPRIYLRADLALGGVADVDGTPLRYVRTRGSVQVDSRLTPGSVSSWKFHYRLPLPDRLDELDGFFSETPWYPHLRLPATAREFPRYLPAPVSVSARLPSPWALASSGHLEVTEDVAGRSFHWTQSAAVAMVPVILGRLEKVERRIDGVTLLGFFEPSSVSVADIFLEYVADVIDFYSQRIGPYGQSTYTLVQMRLPAGIRGLTVPGLTVLSSDDVVPESQFPYLILAHEVAHNWWNFAVELPRWTDGWLREGLPTYSAILFLERNYGGAMMRQELSRSRRIALSPVKPEPLARGFGISGRETRYALTYHKAALVLHMMRTLLGLDQFTELLREFHASFSGSDATTADFRQMAERRYDGDLEWFFSAWLDDSAVPRFEVRYSSRRRESVDVPAYEVTGTVSQVGGQAEGPVLLRIHLDGAPPLERTLWLEPGLTDFSIVVPTPPTKLVFDPNGDLLHGGITVEEVAHGRS